MQIPRCTHSQQTRLLQMQTFEWFISAKQPCRTATCKFYHKLIWKAASILEVEQESLVVAWWSVESASTKTLGVLA